MGRDPLDRAPDDRLRVLAPDGNVVAPDLEPDLDDATLRGMYRDMRFARRFDERAVALQRQGRVGTYAPLAGQEAAQIGSTYALRDDDLVVYQYREHGVVVSRGFPWAYLRYWMGHEAGNAAIADLNVFPLNISIASQVPHATGWSGAVAADDGDTATVVHFGDGATSEGDFHEALNIAGVFDTPTVFFCNNNQWAISVPRERQTASDTIAQKADAYGFKGVQIDGMDPLAVYVATAAARERATGTRRGPRPTLIEAVQYRYGAHTTADDPDAYRDEAELEAWKARDPIDRFEVYLLDRGTLDDDAVADIESDVEATLEEAVEAALTHGDPDPLALFDHVYAESTPRIAEQRAAFERLLEAHGDDAFLEDT